MRPFDGPLKRYSALKLTSLGDDRYCCRRICTPEAGMGLTRKEEPSVGLVLPQTVEFGIAELLKRSLDRFLKNR
jgi:hypothetical protein